MCLPTKVLGWSGSEQLLGVVVWGVLMFQESRRVPPVPGSGCHGQLSFLLLADGFIMFVSVGC